MTIIDGKKISAEIKAEVQNEVVTFVDSHGIVPTIAVIIVGANPASQVYVRNKHKACEELGMRSISIELPATSTESELLNVISDLNNRDDVHGILVQLPLPEHINESLVTESISPQKDVDGFHPINLGNLLLGKPAFVPCTPAGIVELLQRSNVDISGKHVVVIGRSNIVGKPIAQLLLGHNATVTICHSKTVDLTAHTKQADILIVAIGKAKFISAEHLKPGAVVIDVGINRMDDGKLCGDVDFANVTDIVSAITPVPGGVGGKTAKDEDWYAK